jgi:hypothetical protein
LRKEDERRIKNSGIGFFNLYKSIGEKKMHKKQMFIVTILVLASLVLAACGGAQPATKTEAPVVEVPATKAPSEPVTLKIYLLDYTPDTITWLKSDLNPAFEAAHPGVTVEITEGSWSGWDTTFSGFFAAGEGPDIINLGSEMNTLYGESLADMDSYLGEAAWPDIKNFGPALANVHRPALRFLPYGPHGSLRLDLRHPEELCGLGKLCRQSLQNRFGHQLTDPAGPRAGGCRLHG